MKPNPSTLTVTSTEPACASAPASRRLLRLAGRTGALAALGAASPAVRANIVTTTGSFPLFPPASEGSFFWDVDGDGTQDFRLRNFVSSSTGPAFSFAAVDDQNGGRLVVPNGAAGDQISKLSPGFAVGPTLASGFKFHAAAQNGNSITLGGGVGNDALNGGWAYGDTGLFGFKFTSGADTFYGWAEMTIGDRGNAGDGDNYQITQAYYESTPNTAIAAGAVPEPSSTALLALGAAGLGSWRRRKQAA